MLISAGKICCTRPSDVYSGFPFREAGLIPKVFFDREVGQMNVAYCFMSVWFSLVGDGNEIWIKLDNVGRFGHPAIGMKTRITSAANLDCNDIHSFFQTKWPFNIEEKV